MENLKKLNKRNVIIAKSDKVNTVLLYAKINTIKNCRNITNNEFTIVNTDVTDNFKN